MASGKKMFGSFSEFRRQATAICRRFRHSLSKEEITEDVQFHLCEVISACRALRHAPRLPQQNGVPRLYFQVKSYLCAQEGSITSGSLLAFLMENGEWFYHEELCLLRDFLILGALFLDEEGGGTDYLLRLLPHLDEIDFERIYFACSGVERELLKENDGSYRKSDIKTHHLYHERLQKAARKKRADPILLARQLVARANKKGVPLFSVLPPERGNAPRLYFYFLAVLTFTLAALFVVLSGICARTFLMLPFILVTVYAFAKELLPPAFSSIGEKMLPKLASGRELEETKVLVTIATFLHGEEKDALIFDKLEDFYLTNRADNVYFAVLGDLPQSNRRTTDKDASTVAYARGRIAALNSKYGGGFALFLRSRRRSVCENAYICWERKRGGVLELCRYLRGHKTSFGTVLMDGVSPEEIRYLITLDADTNLYAGAVRDMLGTILHPENRAVLDKSGQFVIKGHAVIQPRVIPTLSSVSRSVFARLTGGAGGLDPYAGTASDLYQQVFNEGIFCGKGILDVDAYLAVCDGFFPNERILSHDLVEGNLLRCALASDIVLTDSTPKSAFSYYTRAHRWLRGDMQILPYLQKTVQNTAGQRICNPMSKLSRYKIADNLFRSATPFCAVSAFLLSLFFGGSAMALVFFFGFGYLLLPILTQFLSAVYYRNFRAVFRRFYSVTLPHFLETVILALFRVSAAVYEGYLFIDAGCRTLYRFFISKRNFLNWVTSFDGDGAKNSIHGYLLQMSASLSVGMVVLSLPIGIFRLLGALWAFFPVAMWLLSQERTRGGFMSNSTRRIVMESTHAAWLFFRDFVNEQTNHLPPDNVQFSPVERTAMRTSPTNIGLYLLSVLAARDMDFLTTQELYERASGTAKTLSGMLRWNGHFYNWYDISTLEVIGEPFISTVDSGNLVTSLVAFCEGVKEYVGELPALLDVIRQYERLIGETDFSALYDPVRHLFRIGYHVRSGCFSDSCYDMFMSESRTTSFYAVATGAVPREHYFALGRQVIAYRGRIGVASWSGTAFEYFMPSLLLPTENNSLTDEALAFAFSAELDAGITKEALGGRHTLFGISESGYFAFDHEMNYQYRAFGIEKLSLDPESSGDMVIAPYASFLMLERDPARIGANLMSFHALGAFGKYGFYESIDFEPARVGGGYAIIKSYMSHHVGMSIVAATNALYDGIFRQRFLRHPQLRASKELLCEKIPVSAKSLSAKKRSVGKAHVPSSSEAFQEIRKENIPSYPYNLISPEVVLLSNNKTKLFASSSGHIEMEDGSHVLALSDFDRYSLGGGLRIYAEIDGVTFGLVSLAKEVEGFSSFYEFLPRTDYVEYVAHHVCDKKKYTLSARFSVFPDREAYRVECRVSGLFRRAVFCLCFEPVLDRRLNYLSHKSFSDLFLESRYFSDEKVLVYRRRPKNDKSTSKLLGVTVFPFAESGFFASMRDTVLPLCARESDYAALAKRKLPCADGALIVPFCALKSAVLTPKKQTASFYLSCSSDEEELLDWLTRLGNGEKYANERLAMGNILHLQYSCAGLSQNILVLEHAVLRGIRFGATHRERNPIGDAPLDKNHLWKHGISGDNPIVLAKLSSDNAEQRSRLQELIRLFKYMCIRGVRYDFLIVYTENDHYHAPLRVAIEAMIKHAGCENFVSLTGGIFLLPCMDNDDAAMRAYELNAACVFELSIALEVQANVNPFFVPISEETAALLKRGTEVTPKSTKMPALTPVTRVHGGFFHESGFLVEKSHGNTPWSHVVASENFGTILTENSLGFSFAGNSGLRKLTPHDADAMREDDGERLILRLYDCVDETKYRDYDMSACAGYFNAAFGFAEYYGSIENIDFLVRIAPVGKYYMKRISVSLWQTTPTSLTIFYYVRPCLGARRTCATLYRFRKEKDVLRVTRLDGEALGMKMAIFAKDAIFYTDETAFASDGKLFDGRDKIAVAGVHSGEALKFEQVFYLAAYRTESDFHFLHTLIQRKETLEYQVPMSLFETFTLKTARPALDETCNRWSIYQTLYSRIFARSGFYQVGGAYGFRDQLQDALALIPVLPETAKILILRAAARQYEDGSVQHWWHAETDAGMMTHCSDDFLWLPFVTSEYVRMTGDQAVLQIRLPYLVSAPLQKKERERYEKAPKSGTRETLFSHLLRAVENGMRFGEHGLPLMRSGDWNDGMNFVGNLGRGESVWLAFFETLVFRRMAELCEFLGESTQAEFLDRMADTLVKNIEAYGFDGEWYLRGYYDDGSPLGSATRRDCRIDALPQAFAMMMSSTENFDAERVKKAGNALYFLLFDREYRILKLLTPPFESEEQSPGYIKGYVPGIRENGGQYTHAAVFAALGFLGVNENERGAEILQAITPALRCENTDLARRYKIEPYVFSGDVYSDPAHIGRGGWSFYTGSAAWYRKAVLEVLCGYRQDAGGFSLAPHFSDRFDEFSLTIKRNGTEYHIHAKRAEKPWLSVDGMVIHDMRAREYHFPFDGNIHRIEFFEL